MPPDRIDGQDIREDRRHGWGLLHAWKSVRARSFRTRSFSPPRRLPGDRVAGSARIVEDRRELARFWPVIQNMVAQELRVRYQRSILGFFWSLAESSLDDGNPVMGFLVFDDGL